MQDPEEKSKSRKGEKHIKFTNSVDEARKEQISSLGNSSKMPKHKREVKRFRLETLDQIRVFREARRQWMNSTMDSELGNSAVDKTMYTLQIDSRRMNIMKKLGVKMSMIRPHRKTLRPKICFTFKKNLTQRGLLKAKVQLEARNVASFKKGRLVLMKNFRKQGKRSVDQIAEENETDSDTNHTQTDSDTSGARRKNLSKEETAKNKYVVNFQQVYGSSVQRGEKSGLTNRRNQKRMDGNLEEGEKTEPVTHSLGSNSRHEFHTVVRNMENNPKFARKRITDEEVNEMKDIWRTSHPVPTAKDEEKLTESTKKKPRKKQTVILENQDGGETVKEISIATNKSKTPAELSFNMGNGTDSDEIIKRKLLSKSLPDFKDQERKNATEGATSSLTQKDGTLETRESSSGKFTAKHARMQVKSNTVSSDKTKPSGDERDYEAAIVKNHSKFSTGKKSKKPNVRPLRVSFAKVEQSAEEQEESSNKVIKTLMAVLDIFRKYS